MISFNSKGKRTGVCHMRAAVSLQAWRFRRGRERMRDEMQSCDPVYRLAVKHYWLAELNRIARVKHQLERYISELS